MTSFSNQTMTRAQWTGEALATDSGWRFDLAAEEVAEVRNAITAARDFTYRWEEMSRGDFPLPQLSRKLDLVRHEVEEGRGVALLSGLPVADLDPAAFSLMAYGVSLHLGRPCFQHRSERSLPMTAVTHGREAFEQFAFLSNESAPPFGQPEQDMLLHSDRYDISLFACYQAAARGGYSLIASSLMVYEEMRRRDPSLAEHLLEPSTYIIISNYVDLPVVYAYEDGRRGVYHHLGLARKTAGMREDDDFPGSRRLQAMEMFQRVAQELRYAVKLAPGQMLILNNEYVVHGRDAYELSDNPAHQRVLLRICSEPRSPRPQPSTFSLPWRGTIVIGDD